MEGKLKVKNENNGSRVKKESKYKMDIKKDFLNMIIIRRYMCIYNLIYMTYM